MMNLLVMSGHISQKLNKTMKTHKENKTALFSLLEYFFA